MKLSLANNMSGVQQNSSVLPYIKITLHRWLWGRIMRIFSLFNSILSWSSRHHPIIVVGLSASLHFVTLTSKPTQRVNLLILPDLCSNIIIPILKVRKLRHREVQQLTQTYTAPKRVQILLETFCFKDQHFVTIVLQSTVWECLSGKQ